MRADGGWTLRRRLAGVLIVLTLGTGLLFVGVGSAAYLWLERSILDDVLAREFDRVAADTRPATDADRERYYRPARDGVPPPASIASLPPGSYLDQSIDAGNYHVLVRDFAPGDRAWLLYDVAPLERRERQALLLLLAGVSFAALIAWLLGVRAARLTLRPLDSLVSRITALRSNLDAGLSQTAADGELRVIVAAVNALLAEIRELVNREQAFAAAAAHELRTPLTSIRLASELLALQEHTGNVATPLRRIERALRDASQDLDALLALSRSRALPDAEPVLLHEWLRARLDGFAAIAQASATRLESRLPTTQRTLSIAALGVVVDNLLRNAIRATPGGSVRVELSEVGIVVADDGAGIPADLLAQVFEPGTRGPGGGSGIGLYISRTLADRCGWTLRLDSSVGAGTRAELLFG